MSVIQDNVAQLEPQSNREQPNIEYNKQGSASSFWDTAQQKQSYLDITLLLDATVPSRAAA